MIKSKPSHDKRELSKGQLIESDAPNSFLQLPSFHSAQFEHICVSNLRNKDPSIFSSIDELFTRNSFHPIGTEAELTTGRQGEVLVFHYLKWKYPNEDVKWLNQNGESGRPYDIQLIVKSENNREEFIEVKTTRSYDQNTFPLSIGEVKYLLKHPSNYCIYRVYYADTIDSSTITVINRIEENLIKKHLKLCMILQSQSNEE